MRYVILRDDDTCALTPVECLDRLFAPFLERSLPVNLAVIPNVRTDITYGPGIPEGFLVKRNGWTERYRPLASNKELVGYLRHQPKYVLAQHGYTHEFIENRCEFELNEPAQARERLSAGRECFVESGLPAPRAFVAPYDRFTRTSLAEAASIYRVISTGWFEWRKLPRMWWLHFLAKKLKRSPHWRVGQTILLSHPGCHISYQRDYRTIVDGIKISIGRQRLTVLVSHWWEFFRDGRIDQPLVDVLHALADFLANRDDIRVVTLDDVANGRVPLT